MTHVYRTYYPVINQYNTTWPSKWFQYGGCRSVPGRRLTPYPSPLRISFPAVSIARNQLPRRAHSWVWKQPICSGSLKMPPAPPFKFQFPSKALCFAKCTFLFLSSIAEVWSLLSVCVYIWVNVRHLWVIKLAFQSSSRLAEMFRSKSLHWLPKLMSLFNKVTLWNLCPISSCLFLVTI